MHVMNPLTRTTRMAEYEPDERIVAGVAEEPSHVPRPVYVRSRMMRSQDPPNSGSGDEGRVGGGSCAMGRPYTFTTIVPSLSDQVELLVRDSAQVPNAVWPAVKLNGPMHSRYARDGPLPWQLVPVATVWGIAV